MNFKSKFAVGSALTAASAASFAAVPTAVSDALTGASTDVMSIGALVLGVVVVIATISFLKRVI